MFVKVWKSMKISHKFKHFKKNHISRNFKKSEKDTYSQMEIPMPPLPPPFWCESGIFLFIWTSWNILRYILWPSFSESYAFISPYKLKIGHKIITSIFCELVSVAISTNAEWYIGKYT